MIELDSKYTVHGRRLAAKLVTLTRRVPAFDPTPPLSTTGKVTRTTGRVYICACARTPPAPNIQKKRCSS